MFFFLLFNVFFDVESESEVCFSKIRASDKNEFQIRILHRKIHQLKEKKHPFLYDLKRQ